jgi:predicted nucleotidyltransferase
MPLPVVTERVVGPVADAVAAVVGGRLRCFVVHGSAATGDVLTGYPDLDVLVVAASELAVEEATATKPKGHRPL